MPENMVEELKLRVEQAYTARREAAAHLSKSIGGSRDQFEQASREYVRACDVLVDLKLQLCDAIRDARIAAAQGA